MNAGCFSTRAGHSRVDPERLQLRALKESPVGPRLGQELLQCVLHQDPLRIVAHLPVPRPDARNIAALPGPQLQNPFLFQPEQGVSNDLLGCPGTSRQPGDR